MKFNPTAESPNRHHRILISISFCTVLFLANSSGLLADAQKELLGVWIHKSGPTQFESMEFAIEEKQCVFRSWLHDRPSAFGEWNVEKDVILITLDEENRIEWKLIRVDKKQLQLREKGEESDTIFHKQD